MKKKRFSERMGLEPPPVLQLGSMDERLQNGLWNEIHGLLNRLRTSERGDAPSVEFLRRVWGDHLGGTVDEISVHSSGEARLREVFYELPWNHVFELAEFIAEESRSFVEGCNRVLEREHSAYRFSSEKLIVEITDETQLEAIDKATTETSELDSVHDHLRTAQERFSDREKPDYRNCVKESISAVEALASLMVGEKGTLAESLAKFPEKGIPLHPALIRAWSNTYGYTSDRDGVRHGGTGEDVTKEEVSQAEALYMLVKCSAFVSYLLDLTSKAKIEM